jgi:NAD(P)-dependent dehydrogenase (short-subunit alcohol dehydrogenase family)
VSVAGAKSRAAGNRLGEIDGVAPRVAFLCGPEARWITAQTLRFNGGVP